MSTILDALRKVEGQRPAAADAGELDRQIAQHDAPGPARPFRRFALVTSAVLVAALAGAGMTLFGLSFLQEQFLGATGEAGTPPVAAAKSAASKAKAEASPREAPTVVIAADVLAANRARDPDSEAPATARIAREPEPITVVVERAQNPAGRPSVDVVGSAPAGVSPKHVPEPVRAAATPAASERDPVAELAAAREARVSRAPTQAAPREAPVSQVQKRAAPPPVPAERPAPRVVEIARAVPPPPALDSEPLPVIVRGALPTVSVLGTKWHPRRERRRAEVSVVDDGSPRTREVREGDSIGPFEVAEIGPTGITLLHEGVEMTRRVGAGSP